MPNYSYLECWIAPGREETETVTFSSGSAHVITQNSDGKNNELWLELEKGVDYSTYSLLFSGYQQALVYDFTVGGPQTGKSLNSDGQIDSSAIVEYIGEESITVAGKKVKAKKMKSTIKGIPNFYSFSWFDSNQTPLKFELIIPTQGRFVYELTKIEGKPF